MFHFEYCVIKSSSIIDYLKFSNKHFMQIEEQKKLCNKNKQLYLIYSRSHTNTLGVMLVTFYMHTISSAYSENGVTRVHILPPNDFCIRLQFMSRMTESKSET